jgi:UrcA family protein
MHISARRALSVMLVGSTAALVVAISPAAAQDVEIVVRGVPEGSELRLVSYRDLDLNFMADREVLIRRVDRAVRDVCDFEPGDSRSRSYHDCADRAWARADPQIAVAYAQAAQLAYYYPR